MRLRRIIKKCLPDRITNDIGSLLVRRRERMLGRLSIPRAFDEIYRRRMWQQGDSLSGIGSEGAMAEQYVALVRHYAAAHGLYSAVDGGCGDFAVGSQLAPHFRHYAALDASSHIIEINRRRYSGSHWQHVSFSFADMTETPFPPADLILIRQVFQHLTNRQIEMILKNLEAGSWRRVLITESVHDPLNNPTPNVDVLSHSVKARQAIGSGVFIDQPPFNRAARRIATLFDSQNGAPQEGGLLVFELSRD